MRERERLKTGSTRAAIASATRGVPRRWWLRTAGQAFFVVFVCAFAMVAQAASTLVSQGSTLWHTGLGAATCSGCHGTEPSVAGFASSGHREASNNPAKITAILTCAAGGSCAGVTGGADPSGGQMAGAAFTTLNGNLTQKVQLSLYIGQFKTPSGSGGSLATRVNVAGTINIGTLIPTSGTTGAPADNGVAATDGSNGTTSVADATISGSSVIRNITYTPSANYVGNDSFTYTLTNPTGSSGPHTINVTVVGVDSAATASGRTNNAFSYTITTNGTPSGANPYSVTGTLPSGVTLDTATGVISGTPAAGAAGTYPVTVAVNTTIGAVNKAVTITIIGVTSAATINGTQGTPITTYTTTTNGTTSGANPFSVSVGTLPANLVLDTATGQITGTATNAGTTNVTLSVVTTVGTVTLPVTINIAFAGTPVVTGPATASGTVGTPITMVQLVATNPPITSYAATGLPPGLTLAAGTGQITGTPSQSQAAGNSNVFNVSVSATNGAGPGGSATLAFTINPSVVPAVSGATLNPSQGVAFNYDARAGNVTNLLVSVPTTGFAATGLPTGLSINAAGVISGTPTVSGSFTASVTATNSVGTPTAATFTINATPTIVPLISSPTGVTGTIGSPITPVTMVASNPPVTAYGGTGLPPGITVNPTTGLISGTPTAHGTFNATLTATNAAGPGSLAVTFTIAAVPAAAGAANMTVQLNTATTLDLAPFITGTSITGVRIVTNPTYGTVATSGTRVTYTPRTDYFGADAFTYAAFGAAGESAPAAVKVDVVGRPDPTRQQNVMGTLNAQVQAAQQFARTQISNFSRRLESLHRGGRAPRTAQAPGRVDPVAVAPAVADPFGEVADSSASAANPDARAIDAIAAQPAARARGAATPRDTRAIWPSETAGARPGFPSVSSAASPGAGLPSAPGFADLPQTSTGTMDGAGALRQIPGGGLAADVMSAIATRSLNVAQLAGGNGASAAPASTIGATEFWIEGSLNFGHRGTAASGGSIDFSTSGLSFGVDRRLSENLIVGVGVGVARDRTEIGTDGTKSIAKGASVAAYGSYQPTQNTFIDALVGVGTINFDTERLVAPIGAYAKSDRDGTQIFASLAGGYELRRGGVLWSPYGRIDVSYDRLKDASETGVGNFALHYFGQSMHSVQGAIGLRVESVHATSFGWMSPRARIELRHSFDGDVTSQIAYADQIAGQRYSISTAALERNAISIGIGGDFHMRNGLSLGLDYQLQKSYPEGSAQGIRLRLTQALDGKGVRRPLYERDPQAAGGAAHHDSSDIRFDVGMTYDDNVTRGRLPTETLRDTSVNLAANKVMIFPIADTVRVLVVGTVGGDRFHSYNGLDRLFGGVRGELQYRGSAAFDSPIIAAFGRVVGEQFESKVRRGVRASAGVSIRQPITDRILAFGALAHNERFAKSDVFDTRDNSLQLNLDYALSSDSTIYLAGEYRRGDVVSSGRGSLENIDIAKVFVLDDAFTNTPTFAYKVEATTNIFTLGYNLSFGTRDSLDLSWRRARSTPQARPGFNAAGPWSYVADQFSVVYLVRF